MNSNNSTPNSINLHKIKAFLSKMGLLLALSAVAAGFAIVSWSQAASAHDSSSDHNHVSVSIEQGYGDHDDDKAVSTADQSYIEINLRVAGSGNVLIPGTDGWPAGYGNYNVRTVDSRKDCDEDAFPSPAYNALVTGANSGTNFDIQNRRGTNLTTSSHTIGVTTDSVTVANHHDKYVCVEVAIETPDGDVTEYVSSPDVLDLESSTIEEVIVNDDARNQEYGLGDVIDIVVEFDERVRVEKVTESTGDAAALPYITMPTLTSRNAELLSLDSGTKLTFRYIVQFGDDATAGSDVELADLDNAVIELADGSDDGSTSDYIIMDLAGNLLVASGTTFTPSPAEEVDFRSGDVVVEVETMVKRMGDRLVFEVTPDEYDNSGTETDTVHATTIPVAFSTDEKPDDMTAEGCEEDVVDSRARAAGEEADKPAGSDYWGIDLPKDPDDMYYCFQVTDALTRVTYTDVYRYVTDNAGPRISVATVNNVLTITATDAVSGIDEDSISWRILGVGGNDRCIDGLGAFSNSSDTITITSAHDGLRICIRAKDNAGNWRHLAADLRYDASAVVVPETPVTPGEDDMVQQPDDDMDDMTDPSDDDMTDDGTATDCDVVVCFPSNWDDLTVSEKIAANPYKCLDTTQIRGDNGRCISGGSALDDDAQVIVDGQPAATTPTDTATTPVVVEDDDTATTATDDDEEAEETTASVPSVSLTYTSNEDGTGAVVVDAPASVSDLRYTIVEEATCDESIAEADFTAVDAGSGIGLEAGQVEDRVYVCVRGTGEDGGSIHALKRAEAAATDTGEATDTGTTETGDEDEGGNTFLIVIIVIGIIAVGIVVAIMLSSKKN